MNSRERGQGLIEYALILILLAVIVIVIVALLGGIPDWQNAPCSDFANRAVKDVPVRCLEYFSNAR